MSYLRDMETKRGVLSGLRRGMEIAIDPDPARLRELQKAAKSRDRIDAAWTNVGKSFEASLQSHKKLSRG